MALSRSRNSTGYQIAHALIKYDSNTVYPWGVDVGSMPQVIVDPTLSGVNLPPVTRPDQSHIKYFTLTWKKIAGHFYQIFRQVFSHLILVSYLKIQVYGKN